MSISNSSIFPVLVNMKQIQIEEMGTGFLKRDVFLVLVAAKSRPKRVQRS